MFVSMSAHGDYGTSQSATLMTIDANATIHHMKVRLHGEVADCIDAAIWHSCAWVVTAPWAQIAERMEMVAMNARRKRAWFCVDLN